MPCDTIQTSEVDLKNPNIKLLMDALHLKGLNPRLHDNNRISFTGGSYINGAIECRGDLEASDIKIAYSEQIVRYAAKQFGWKLEVQTGKQRRGVAMTIKAKK